MARSWSLSLAAAVLGLSAVFLASVAGCAVLRPEEPPAPVQLERGAELYAAHCQTCHGGATGGSMMDIPPPHNANGHTWHHPDCQLVEIVRSGSGAMGEMMRRMMGVPESAPRMPAFRDTLSDEDVAAILAYIKTWWTAEQRAAQAQVTRQRC